MEIKKVTEEIDSIEKERLEKQREEEKRKLEEEAKGGNQEVIASPWISVNFV